MNQKCADLQCLKFQENEFDNNHSRSFRHYCINGNNCPHKVEDLHSFYFYHDRNFKLISEKKKCPMEDCKLHPNDTQHKESYFHVCSNGRSCKSISDEVHINRYIHPCPNGDSCSNNDSLHKLQFIHIENLQLCPNPKECKEKSKSHWFSFLHHCEVENCNLERNDHKQFFLHACKEGFHCKKFKNVEIVHLKHFYHDSPKESFWPHTWMNPLLKKNFQRITIFW
jgi:hypothetical protein